MKPSLFFKTNYDCSKFLSRNEPKIVIPIITFSDLSTSLKSSEENCDGMNEFRGFRSELFKTLISYAMMSEQSMKNHKTFILNQSLFKSGCGKAIWRKLQGMDFNIMINT